MAADGHIARAGRRDRLSECVGPVGLSWVKDTFPTDETQCGELQSLWNQVTVKLSEENEREGSGDATKRSSRIPSEGLKVGLGILLKYCTGDTTRPVLDIPYLMLVYRCRPCVFGFESTAFSSPVQLRSSQLRSVTSTSSVTGSR